LALYEKYKAIAAGAEYATLSAERRKILDNSLRDFRLSGAELPEAQKPRFAELQEQQAALSKAVWKFTLHFPSYFPVLQYADNRAMRETLYRAYVTRASELGPQYGGGKAEWDNTKVVAETLALRREEAVMLGYANFAEVSLAPKMAESPAQVTAFLEDLA
ncbi:M3 family metallopeptidase, partial [Burkholderia cepacia]|uniref:M3 family metallopeptidase n=1 Tax=Burkholderia cepacia TaxID=292 RepID=UPI001FC8DD4E